jgi:hypothetical protein
MRTETLRQKPGRDVEILVVRFGEVFAPGAGFFECRRFVRNSIACR